MNPPQRRQQRDYDMLIQPEAGREHWVSDPTHTHEVCTSKRGLGHLIPTNVVAMLQQASRRHHNKTAIRWESSTTPGTWITRTWADYHRDIKTAATALLVLGVQQFGCVNIIGFNSYEWFVADLAAIMAGAKAAGIYTTNGPEACQYVTEHSQASVVFVENQEQLEKFLCVDGGDCGEKNLSNLKAIVVYGGGGGNASEAPTTRSSGPEILTWAQFMELGQRSCIKDHEVLRDQVRRLMPGHCSTLIYTSGTTGTPKAVMISHDNSTWIARSLLSNMPLWGREHTEHIVSYLPLSHIAAQLIDIHLPIIASALSDYPTVVSFATPQALKGDLGRTLKLVRPTMFFGVPRVWEKMQERMKAMSAAAAPSNMQVKMVAWAKKQGAYAYERGQVSASVAGRGGNGWMFPLAKATVFDRVRAKMGLDRCEVLFTGAAPIARDTLEFFGALDLRVLELYGLSECTGPHAVNFPATYEVGSIGRALPGCETRIAHVDGRDAEGEGEICIRGRHVMMGYMHDPDKTREAIDEEGFLHTGDVGRIDCNGFLFITGRIKELLITAGGENVAPVPIEASLKRYIPALSNVMMVGDRRKYNVVLVTLKCQETTEEEKTEETSALLLAGEAAEVSRACKSVEDAMKHKTFADMIQRGLDRVNAEAVSRAQNVQKFAILPRDFTVPGGELTPTLKLKRSVVSEMYKDVIEKLYSE